MMAITKSNNRQTKKDRWYLDIMSPNTKGEKFAWLDPTSIFINGEAFHDLLDDLVSDLVNVKCDVVAGLDAMGFVLGTALATRLNVGFLPIRKAGKLCVVYDGCRHGRSGFDGYRCNGAAARVCIASAGRITAPPCGG